MFRDLQIDEQQALVMKLRAERAVVELGNAC
jgi:hypothetical protein